MSGAKKQRGFTIIEVTLFLAISSLLLATLVFGMQRMVSQVRFNDSINSLTAYVQAQYEEVRSGVNPRGIGDVCGGGADSAPGTTKCLLIGKVMQFSLGSSNVQTSYVVASDTTGVTEKDSDHQALLHSKLQVISTGQETYEIQWGATFEKGRIFTGTTADVDTIAILRSPVSSQILVYTYKSGKPITDAINGTGNGAGTLNQQSAYLIKSAEAFGARGAGVCVDPGNISSAVHSVMPLEINSTDAQIGAACAK